MKKLLLLALTLVLTLSLAFTLAACGGGDKDEEEEYVSINEMENNCRRLKEDGKIASYSATEVTIYATTADGKMFAAQKLEDEDAAVKNFDENKAALDELKDAGIDVSDYVIKRMGDIVVTATSKDLYNKIVC